MSDIYLSRIMLKEGCHVQTMKEAPGGAHGERHHVATKSVTICLNTETGLIKFSGYGEEKYAHVSSMVESQNLAKEAANAAARIKHAASIKQPPNRQDEDLVAAAIGAGINVEPKK